jgi:3-oxoacyl-[acyl-carrier protein] reductase
VESVGRDRWAFVAGGSSGIGRAAALLLARVGWHVGVQFRRSRSAALDVVRQAESMGRKGFAVAADLVDASAAVALVDRVWTETGGVHAWIHVAGADVLTGAEAALSFEEKLERTVRVDLIATILACRAAGRRMAQRGGGSIVTIGWDQSATGMEGDGGQMFTAVKGGVAAFSRSLAKSLAPAVRVNCVAPGWIQTAWGRQASQRWQERVLRETPLRRWGTAEDVARTIAFLVSDDAGFITGQTINVNGGVVTS